jgi:hypothetical protein
VFCALMELCGLEVVVRCRCLETAEGVFEPIR